MKRWTDRLEPFLAAAATALLLAFLAAAAVLFALHVLRAVQFRYPLDYGEAPLVDQALRLASGENIYRPNLDTPPYTISNYPPLYPLLLAPLVKLFGPCFAAGRWISILCAVLTALLLGKIVGQLSRDRLAAAISGLIFLAFPYVLGWSKLARVDLLALALSAAGIFVLVRRPATWRGIVGSGVLLVAAIYTRQSYALAAPLAAFVWLWTQNRRRALALAALVGGLSLALFVILNALTRGGFFYNVITANVNEFKMEDLARSWRNLRSATPILLLLGGLYLGTGRAFDKLPGKTFEVSITSRISLARMVSTTPKIWPLVAPYLIGAALSALTIGKVGSNINYLLELCAALSLAAGAWIAWTRRRPWLRSALLVLLAVQSWLLIQTSLRDPVADLRWRTAQSPDAFAELNRIIADAEDPVLADEFMGLLTLQRKPLYIQPFEVTQLANAGVWDQTPLLNSIRAREFPAILIHHFRSFPVYQQRWTEEMLAAVMEQYAPAAFLNDTIVYRPAVAGAFQPVSLTACPESPWRLPTRSELGLWAFEQHLLFMGAGYEGSVPVYAVADGLLTRRVGWSDAVAIRHDDPLRPGQVVWTYYAGMASAWSGRSFVEPRFAPGNEGVPVKKGQLLGYQGQFSAQLGTPYYVHLHFAILPARTDGAFPAEAIASWPEKQGAEQQSALNPSAYLGIISGASVDQAGWMPLHCLTGAPGSTE